MRRTILCAITIALALPVQSSARPPGDPLQDRQWNLAVIGAQDAWETTRGEGAVIAILDSGVDVRHPDLRGNVRSRGYDAVEDAPGPGTAERHGTYVAGIAAAVGGNGEGISGVAPDARILPVRVCAEVCTQAAVVRGIRYAVEQGADVVNMSFYVPTIEEEETDAVLRAVAAARSAGVVVVAAAGNNTEPWCVEPAASALCVGATDREDIPTTYSNHDVAMLSNYLVAPGGSGLEGCAGMVTSTTPPAPQQACPVGKHYAASTGTSGASPHVAGVAALLASMGATSETIERCILDTAVDLGPPGRDPVFGFGRLDAAGAVACAQA